MLFSRLNERRESVTLKKERKKECDDGGIGREEIETDRKNDSGRGGEGERLEGETKFQYFIWQKYKKNIKKNIQ